MRPDERAETSGQTVNGESKSGSPGRLLTADEVAELLGVSKEWVWEQSRLGAIPTITLGRFRR